jgi:hypothetical protein
MALKGNLRDISISNLLNLINLARKSGALIVESPEKTVHAFFREGKLAYAQDGEHIQNLAAILYRSKSISPAQYSLFKSRASQMSDKELGLLLVNSNYVSQHEILSSLQNYYATILSQLFTWTGGHFRFETDLVPPEGKIPLRVNLENIILEGTRRQKEWGHLQDEIPNLDIALKFPERPGANIQNVKFNLEEWRVVNYVHPKNTVRRIARATHHSDMEIRQIVYRLLEAGLVELVRPIGQVAALSSSSRPQVALPGHSREERKSLLHRIIGRIRSL